MELEFDKEIDAILRRARGGEGAGGNGAAATHLDADAIVAFVENAVPETVRRSYTSHFADCTRCRKLLSQTILMNELAVVSTDKTVVPGVTDAIAAVPWYAKIFRTPGLAVAMGALVITFTGILGYMVFRPREDAANSTISQTLEQAPVRSGPYETGVYSANTSANSNSTISSNTPAGVSTMSNSASNAPVSADAAPEAKPAEETAITSRSVTELPIAGRQPADMLRAEPPKTAAAPPAPVAAAPTTGGAAGADKKAEDERTKTAKEKDDDAEARKQLSAVSDSTRARRDAPVAAAKSGPSRSGPVQMQSNQVGNIAGEMPVKRVVGGKTFENRQGAWYDQSYRGQATTNYRRSSVEYKGLDAGLRSIADTLGGTVVVVWKGKAYRIN